MNDSVMRPIIVLPPNTMAKEDVARLTENGICVVEATDPANVRFLDPILSAADRPMIEQAAVQLSRILLNGTWGPQQEIGRQKICSLFVECLVKGTKLDRNPTQQERESTIYNEIKEQEIRRLAREEARVEREAMKIAAKKASVKKESN